MRYSRPSSAQLILFEDVTPARIPVSVRRSSRADLEAELVDLRDMVERALRRLRDDVEEAIEELRADLADEPDAGQIDVAIEALDEALTEALASAALAVS